MPWREVLADKVARIFDAVGLRYNTLFVPIAAMIAWGRDG